MADIQPIQNERHSGRRWKRTGNFSFAAQDSSTPLMLDEVARAALAMPIAFVPDPADPASWQLVAILGLQQGRNICVDANGVWQADYIPAVYRVGPFRLGRVENGERVLCIDEEQGLAAEDEEGEPFFGADGKPTEELAKVWAFLNRLTEKREETRAACALLARLGLIQPWPLELDFNGMKRPLQGLYRVDPAAFDALPIEALGELRAAGALQLACIQSITGQNFGRLVQYAGRGPVAQQQAATNGAAGTPSMSIN